jgi:hypothetical protein
MEKVTGAASAANLRGTFEAGHPDRRPAMTTLCGPQIKLPALPEA